MGFDRRRFPVAAGTEACRLAYCESGGCAFSSMYTAGTQELIIRGLQQ